MNIALSYTVHSANIERVPTEAVVNGVTVSAFVERLVVELAAEDGDHGHTFRLPVASAADLAARLAALRPGSAVMLTLSAGDAK